MQAATKHQPHISAEMVAAGVRALVKFKRVTVLVPGTIPIEMERLAEALPAVFRAMKAAGSGRDPTAAERQRRHRDKLNHRPKRKES